ncbi:hypothetical protein K2173_004094 [Erythroxylum novogranatense]|uniref:Expansin-like EG45 domain-containing protein n=1 Tax=Erythroxylum novogranatense TaxID=1862640 RepID=A0AAV8S7B8_9ROSI|nr:hypothetical protein K2173_004094 [Erythroxylum novogranatense]
MEATGGKVRVPVILWMVLCLLAVAQATETLAVYYNPPYTRSACNGNSYTGPWVTGVSAALWANNGACGKRMRVRCVKGANKAPHPCKQGSVDVTIVDFCREPCEGTINLTKDAFSRIASTDAGKVVVDYSFI